jgi:hypothetical protein
MPLARCHLGEPASYWTSDEDAERQLISALRAMSSGMSVTVDQLGLLRGEAAEAS